MSYQLILDSLLERRNGGLMLMDWKETPNAHVFQIDLPGLTKQDVKLELVPETRLLCVSADRSSRYEEDEEEDEKLGRVKWHCRERKVWGAFSRQFRLPENAKVDDEKEIKAWMRDGVLVVTVTKDEQYMKKKKSHPDSKGRLGRFVCCKA